MDFGDLGWFKKDSVPAQDEFWEWEGPRDFGKPQPLPGPP